MTNFWHTLKKPISVLAPMDNVTDTVFRQIVARCAAPDVFFTEFVCTDTLVSKGAKTVMRKLAYTEQERPLVAQIWGNKPENYLAVTQMLRDMKFDGIDINMGCPDKSIVHRGCCSGLINTPSLAQEIIRATQQGAGDLPVSVKTRIGLNEIKTEEWIGNLLETEPDVITIHARTQAEMSKVPAHWDEFGVAVNLRDRMNKKTLLIGNGDIRNQEHGEELCRKYGLDGYMIGTGIFQNLWAFNKSKNPDQFTHKQKLELLIDHLTLFYETRGDGRHFEAMKKFYKVYVNGVDDATEFRLKLMDFHKTQETIDYLLTRIASLS